MPNLLFPEALLIVFTTSSTMNKTNAELHCNFEGRNISGMLVFQENCFANRLLLQCNTQGIGNRFVFPDKAYIINSGCQRR